MTILILSLIVQIALIVHVVRTGRNMLWIWAILLLPVAGSFAYAVVEVIPSLLESHAARRTLQRASRLVNPHGELRRASRLASVTDTVEAKAKLGAALTARGSYPEAIATYRSGLRGLYEFDPTLLLGLATAEFESGEPLAASRTLETLFAQNPDFVSPDGRLLQARALEDSGNVTAARSAYSALLGRYPGLEATVRYAQLLARLGEQSEAHRLFEDVVRGAEIAPSHVRRAQAEWIAIARRAIAR